MCVFSYFGSPSELYFRIKSCNDVEFDDKSLPIVISFIRNKIMIPLKRGNFKVAFTSLSCTLVLFTNPSARAGYDTRSIFKRSLTGLNSEFSFS